MSENSQIARVDESAIGAVGQQFNWVGLNPTQIKGVAQAMALSGMFPDVERDSAKAFVKIMAGQEMGIAPFQAMSDIAIIKGKAAPGGNIHASKVKSHPKYDYRLISWDNKGCEIEFFERVAGKKESLGKYSFGEEDAKNAGLINNDNYKKYARSMYFNRAITGGIRAYCPDALNGVNAYTPEELGAVVDEEGRVVDYQPERVQPKAAPEPKPSRADTAKDAEIIENPTAIIKMIGTELLNRGFDKPEDRQVIALGVAGVSKPSDMTSTQWHEVLRKIQSMSQDDLAWFTESAKTQAEAVQEEKAAEAEATETVDEDEMPEDFLKVDRTDDAVPVTDEDLDAIAAETEEAIANRDKKPEQALAFTLPEFKKGATASIPINMRTFANRMYKFLGLEGETAISNYNQSAIGKDKPSTFEEMNLLIGILIDEANLKATNDK